jgi:UDP-3-O-[3-hydroxymyristoyl] N-acetylglucosamine deacetylase
MNQNTIRKEISISGIGIHSGRKVSLTLKPAFADSGIVFIRTDLDGQPRFTVSPENVTDTSRGTTLGGSVHTVEHLLSALYALSITNLEIDINGPELPILDGSGKPFCDAVMKAGLLDQKLPVRQASIREPAVVRDGDRCLIALPSDRFRISFMINYPVPFIGAQYHSFEFDRNAYVKEIAPARTYGFMSELEALKAKGLALGASSDNAIAITDKGYAGPLRFHDELVRHKILDLIGDLSLAGREIKAHVIGIRSGHDMNVKLAKIIKEVG